MTHARMTDDGIAMLRELEGAEREPYRDVAGLLTIGVGHLLTRDEISSGKLRIGGEWVKWRDGLTDEQIDQLLRDDLDDIERHVTRVTYAPVCPHQFDALVSFAFNVGPGAYQRSTLLKRVNSRDYEDVPTQFRRWVYAGGRKVRGLAIRRETEVRKWMG